MKSVIRIVLVTSLSVLSACDRSPPSEQSPDSTETATVETPTASPSLQAGQYTVDLSEKVIVIRANQVNELVLFKAVAKKGNFQLLAETLEWRTVSVDIHANTLQAALVELVGAYPYEIVYAPVLSGEETLSEVVIGNPDPDSEADLAGESKKNRKRAKREVRDPGKAALLYIKEYDPLGQQQAYLEKLQDPTPEIRAAAAKEIMPTSENLHTMIDLLANDPSPKVRLAATWSLEVSEEAEAPQAIESLVKCLDDKDFTVVAGCADALGFIGDETTIVYLQPLLEHSDEDVRKTALEAIRFLQ